MDNVSLKEVTVGEIIDALERNGFKQSRKAWIRVNNDETVRSACAMTQAAINLGIGYIYMADMLQVVAPGIKYTIMDMNDRYNLSCKEIAKRVRAKYKNYLSMTIEVPTKEYKIREKKSV